jgi:hypothetical protein
MSFAMRFERFCSVPRPHPFFSGVFPNACLFLIGAWPKTNPRIAVTYHSSLPNLRCFFTGRAVRVKCVSRAVSTLLHAFSTPA